MPVLTGLGLGGEWATGATLIAETWPTRVRAKGQGVMQSAFGWGSFLAAAAWYFLAPAAGALAWRFLFRRLAPDDSFRLSVAAYASEAVNEFPGID